MGDEHTTSSTTPAASLLGRLGRKVVIAIVGGVVTIAGIIMLVTPGPGILTIILGLSLLGREFPTVRKLVSRLRAAAPGSGARGR